VKRTKSSGNHTDPVKWLARSSYETVQKTKGGADPTPAVLPWAATQGRTLLAEQDQYIRDRYYKGGVPFRTPPFRHHNRDKLPRLKMIEGKTMNT